MAILAAPILTRLYSPSDFGALAIFVSILSVLVVIVSLKYQLAIPLPAEDHMAVNLVAIAMLSVIGITLLTVLFLFFLGGEIVELLNMQALKPYLWIIPLSLLGAGVYQVLHYWAIRKQDFYSLARTKINQGIGMVTIQIVGGLLITGPLGLLLGDAIGRTAGSGTIARTFWKKDRRLLKELQAKRIKLLAVRYKKFPLISSLSGIINSSGLQVAPIMLASLYGASVVGLFSLTQKIVGIPLQFVGTSIAQVYTSEIALLINSNPDKLASHFLKRAKILLLIGGLPILIIGQICPFIFSFVFGHEWEEAGRYAQVLSIRFAIGFIVVPLSSTLNILERQGTQLFWDSCRLCLIIGIFLICSKLKLAPYSTVTIYSIAMSFSYLILFLLSYSAIHKRIGKNS